MEVVRIELGDGPGRARYDALFEACPAAFVQQSTWWAEVVAELGPDRPVFLLAVDGGRDVAGLPLYSFDGPAGRILTSVPQPGPLGGVFTHPGLPASRRPAAYAALLDAALEMARESGCLALTVITNPFAPDAELYEAHAAPTWALENFTQWIPLPEVPRRSGGQRNNLARARRHGFTVESAEGEAAFDEWYALHRRRHEQVGATPLPRRLFENIRRVLVPRGKAFWLLARDPGGRLAAGTVYVRHRDVCDVYAISMDSAWAGHAPNALLADASLARAAADGARVYNWQSSVSRDSGVYVHKRQWGSLESPYFFLTWRLCPAAAIAALGPAGVRAAFPGHYLLPFAAFDGGLEGGRFRKA